MSKASKIWKTRTCQFCKKRFNKIRARIDHEFSHNESQTAVNEANAMEYSHKQHIADLSAQLSTVKTTNYKLVYLATKIVGLLLEEVRCQS